ncbi:hypothetical protein WMF38_06600 [Sorangium sp. So ce118]
MTLELNTTVAATKLPPMYHFTRVESACAALQDGIRAAVTKGDQLQIAGVWLSPNVYGHGSDGSFFGAIGLKISENFLAMFRAAYTGPSPQYADRHRYILLRSGHVLPVDATERTEPETARRPNASREFLLLESVPEDMVDGICFGARAGKDGAYNKSEHRRCLAYLIATRHRLMGHLPYPHSTEPAVGHGWWIFDNLRDWLTGAASKSGKRASTKELDDLLLVLARNGEPPVLAALADFDAETVWNLVTDAYSVAYAAATGVPVNLNRDAPYKP